MKQLKYPLIAALLAMAVMSGSLWAQGAPQTIRV